MKGSFFPIKVQNTHMYMQTHGIFLSNLGVKTFW